MAKKGRRQKRQEDDQQAGGSFSPLSMVWSTRRRKVATSVIAGLSMMLGLVTGWSTAYEAWDEQGLPTFATRGWVRVKTAQLKDIQLDINAGKREQYEVQRDKLEIDLLQAKSLEERVKNQQLQRKLQQNIDALERQEEYIRRRK